MAVCARRRESFPANQSARALSRCLIEVRPTRAERRACLRLVSLATSAATKATPSSGETMIGTLCAHVWSANRRSQNTSCTPSPESTSNLWLLLMLSRGPPYPAHTITPPSASVPVLDGQQAAETWFVAVRPRKSAGQSVVVRCIFGHDCRLTVRLVSQPW